MCDEVYEEIEIMIDDEGELWEVETNYIAIDKEDVE